MTENQIRVLTLFGTRPEVIKLAPVIRQLEQEPEVFRSIVVASGQHEDLAQPFIASFGIKVHHELRIMEPGQTPNRVCSKVLAAMDALLEKEQPHLVLVQGDTSTALAGALGAFHRRVPVGHVEAGLRSGDPLSPFPEEMNRRLITRLASFHFAATARNRDTLLQEGVPESAVFLTGNPVVDALKTILSRPPSDPSVTQVLEATHGLKRIVLTTHRRESFGEVMSENLRVLRRFVEANPDTALVFPVHPNPVVVETSQAILAGHPRIHLIRPLGYPDFVCLLSRAWLIVSDSGGVQEEAPSLGKPLLVLRENTERPEAVASGVAKLVGGDPQRLAAMLEEVRQPGSWAEAAARVENPFGRGDSGKAIIDIITRVLGAPSLQAQVK